MKRMIPDVPLDGIKGHPSTPDPETAALDPRRELAKCLDAFKVTYDEIATIVSRMTSLKIYSCDDYEIYSGCNGFMFDWLEWDKVSLALHSAGLEVKRMDILHWVAIREHTPLPAEIVAIIQRMLLDWKHTVHLTPLEKVDDKHGLKTLIATSGLAKYRFDEDTTSDRSIPWGSSDDVFQASETSDTIELDYIHAVQYDSPAARDDGRYQDTALEGLSLEFGNVKLGSLESRMAIEIENLLNSALQRFETESEESAREYTTTSEPT